MVRKMYIRAGFLNNVTAKIGLSPQTEVKKKIALQPVLYFSSPPFFLFAHSIFPFLVLF